VGSGKREAGYTAVDSLLPLPASRFPDFNRDV
jgi:hypothetical protein